MKIESASLRHAVRNVLKIVPGRTLNHAQMFKPSVNLVCRSVHNDWHGHLFSRRFENVQSSLSIDGKILLRIGDGSRYSNLRGEMKYHICPPHGLLDCIEVTYVTFD